MHFGTVWLQQVKVQGHSGIKCAVYSTLRVMHTVLHVSHQVQSAALVHSVPMLNLL